MNENNSFQPSSPVNQAVRWIVYAMLVLSFATTLLLGDKLWAAAKLGSLPIWAAMLPIVTFTAFGVVYTVDRWLLIKRHDYPVPRAFLQVALALTFITLLWPHQASHLRATRLAVSHLSVVNLLKYRDARVRALACEVLGYRGENSVYEAVAEAAREDKSEDVRTICQEALQKLTAP